MEASSPHDLRSSSYGYYYQMLITQSLHGMGMMHHETETIFNYAADLAFAMLCKKRSHLSATELRQFHQTYCNTYDVRIDFEKLSHTLTGAGILDAINGDLQFKYRYMFYFFTAKYLSDHLEDKQIRTLIEQMTQRLHVESFANILIFLIYHSGRDPFVLDTISKQAEAVFSNLEPFTMEEDSVRLNELMDTIPKVVLGSLSVKDARARRLEAMDETPPAGDLETPLMEQNLDVDANIPTLDWVSEINRGLKVLELLGQLLTNFAGSLKANPKLQLCDQAYVAGLRMMRSVLETVERDLEGIVDFVEDMLKSEGVTKDEEKEIVAGRIVFGIHSLLAYALTKRIAGPIGNKVLAPTLEQVKRNRDTVAVNLVDLAIKLDSADGIPMSDIEELHKRLSVEVASKPVETRVARSHQTKKETYLVSKNPLASSVMQRLVRDRLYMFPVPGKDKQRICNLLGIPIESQRLIDVKSEERQRK
jgi:hypothetical protein